MSTVTYSGDGANEDFIITFPYVSRPFVQVYVDDVLQVEGVDYTFTTDTNINISPAPPVGVNNVELRRVTGTTPTVDFVNGAALDESDLDRAFNQVLHLSEEAVRDAISGMGKVGANWDGEGVRITNVAAPISSTDVATQDSISGQVAAADASATAASSSASAASGSASAASTSASNAATSASNASTSETNAATSETNAAASAASVTGVYPTSGMTLNYVLKATSATTVNAVPARFDFLSTQGATSGTEAIIPLGGSTSISQFCIQLQNFSPSDTQANLNLQFSVDGGVSYENGASDNAWSLYDVAPSATRDFQSAASSYIQLARFLSNSALSRYMEIEVFVGASGAIPTAVMWRGACNDNAGIANIRGAGTLLSSNTRPTHLRLYWETGETFTSGSWDLYGRTSH
jgi:hypothetical protein